MPPRIRAVVPRHDPPAHEEIDVAVAVVIGRHDTRAAHVFVGRLPTALRKVAPPVVQVQAVLERGRHLRELAAAAHDVQVGVSIAVRVEDTAPMSSDPASASNSRSLVLTKPAVGLLDQQLPGLTLGAR